MPIGPGTTIGPYQIRALIGAGGMGEVYAALDMKLGRQVALKVLPERFASDPHRLARLEREARVLAALNHPNIAAVYGFEERGEFCALVLELVEGPTLADLIARGPLPLDDGLPIARQIAQALEGAHEQGIVHRDLKPSNIKLRPDGTVKVLDFGIAKVFDPAAAGSGNGEPTITATMDVVVGTPAYMSPEQATGKSVDRRADMWAFGVVLFEMLAGTRPFEGGSTDEVISEVLRSEPDWSRLPANTPDIVGRLLRRCLQKDRARRIRDIADARLELDDAASPPSVATTPAGRLARRWAAGAWIVGLALAAIAGWVLGRTPADTSAPAVTRFTDTFPAARGWQEGPGSARQDLELEGLAVSSDGRVIVYATGRGLYVRSLSDFEARLIPGTETAYGTSYPAFSPDGRSIVYFEGNAAIGGVIQTVAVTGGTPRELKRMDFIPYGISWGSAGILFARGFGKEPKGVVRLTPTEGQERMLIATGDDFPQMPQWLPDGDSVLFTLASGLGADRWDRAHVIVQSLKSRARTIVIDGAGDARYLPTGYIAYVRGAKVFMVPFDPGGSNATRTPVEVLDNVPRASPVFDGRALFAVSPAGTLVYGSARRLTSELVWVEHDGTVRPIGKEPGSYRYVRVSPDGGSFAVETEEEDTSTIWVGDFEAGHALRRFTFGEQDHFPTWSPDGQFIVFQSERDGRGGLFRQRADGTSGAERLTTAEPDTLHEPESWSPDGGTLLFRISRGHRFSSWSYSFTTRSVEPFGGIESDIPPNATFSPDGKWVAYMWRNAHQFLIFAQSFPANGTKYQVVEGGILPTWGADGRSIFYFHGAGIFARVNVATSPMFAPGVPIDLAFKFTGGTGQTAHRGYDPTKDGRFLGLVRVREPDEPPPGVHVVLNWLQEIRRN